MTELMKQRFRMYRRQGGVFYAVDRQTGNRESLKTSDSLTAKRLLQAKNEAQQQPIINRQIARAYLAVGDPEVSRRTWGVVMDEIIKTKRGETQHRWRTAAKDKAFEPILGLTLFETNAQHFLRVLEKGKVSTNIYLRRVHNFALDIGWLPWPVLPKRKWPAFHFKPKRAITLEEHQAIVTREINPERKAFYQLAWHLGASQTDISLLEAGNIDWGNRIITYARKKTGEVASVRFDEEVAAVLRERPSEGHLFPYLRTVRPGDRATEFKQRCQGLGIKGVTLQSYRYAWAERAKTAGYPERFAQQALGHNSKAVHRAYAKKAHVILPSLGEYEQSLKSHDLTRQQQPAQTSDGQVVTAIRFAT